MVRFLLLSIAFLICLALAVSLLVLMFVVLAMACVVGVPLYILGKRHFGGALKSARQRPIERLQQLYAEGKIDLFEFERRVANLLALES